MAFFIVLHHPRDQQRWGNAWAKGSTDRIEAITTTPALAKRCVEERRVFVHRCGFDKDPPSVVCEAKVVAADRLGSQTLVRFQCLRTMRVVPPVVPGQGQNFYEAEEPD